MNIEKMIKCGFVRDENCLQLKEVLKDNTYFKEVHIDIYPENPLIHSTTFMLLLRTSEKNTVISNDGDRVIFKKNDINKTHFMNVLFSKITECFFKTCENYFEIILNIQNTHYRITVFN